MELLEITICFESWEALYGFNAGCMCLHDLVGRLDSGVGDVFVLELHCVAETFAIGGFDVASVCSIVFR